MGPSLLQVYLHAFFFGEELPIFSVDIHCRASRGIASKIGPHEKRPLSPSYFCIQIEENVSFSILYFLKQIQTEK